MSKLSAIDDLEGLVANLLWLFDAEEAAVQAYPGALPEIRSILDDTVADIIKRASAFLGVRSGLCSRRRRRFRL